MIRVGCCGWPVGREEYFRHFGLVEIQESYVLFNNSAMFEDTRRFMALLA